MLKMTYATEAEVPAEFKSLYTNLGGVWTLTQVENIKTVSDVERVQEGLRKEREDHGDTRTKLRAFGDLDPTEVYSKLDRIAELEAANADKIDDAKINQMVEGRIISRLAPIERELNESKASLLTANESIVQYKVNESKRTIHDAVRKASTEMNVVTTAVSDLLFIAENVFEVNEVGAVVTKANSGTTPGIDASVWLTESKTSRPHWFPASQNAGGRGNAGGGVDLSNNPFSAEGWNITQQGVAYRNDPAQAEMLAKSAGTKIGGPRPTKK